jgi:hypothetical protein
MQLEVPRIRKRVLSMVSGGEGDLVREEEAAADITLGGNNAIDLCVILL